MEDAWQAGFDAYRAGKGWLSNPYPEFGDANAKFDLWDEGWRDARKEDGRSRKEREESFNGQ